MRIKFKRETEDKLEIWKVLYWLNRWTLNPIPRHFIAKASILQKEP